MIYPTISEYLESIKSAEENFNELTHLRPVLDSDGNPVMSSGNFAVVFKMTDGTKFYAIKCFTKEQAGRAEAYKLIEKELEKVESTYIVKLKYLEKELYVDTRQTDETEFPVLQMDWVDGKPMDAFIQENIEDKHFSILLPYNFSKLAQWLFKQPFAHSDLKPDNILVRFDGSITLVDYDGMFVPAMEGQPARELGTPEYRHPERTIDEFDAHIDDYALCLLLLYVKTAFLNPKYQTIDSFLALLNDLILHPNLQNLEPEDINQLMSNPDFVKLYGLFLNVYIHRNLQGFPVKCLELDGSQNSPNYHELFSKALHSDGEACYELGQYYEKEEDYAESLKWYEKAAQLGHPKATCGICRSRYKNPQKTKKEIFEEFVNAAKLGSPMAKCRLGNMYSKGFGYFSKNLAESFRYYREAAEQGYASAQYHLGLCYEYGWGLEYGRNVKNETRAVEWWRKAAEQGHAGAQYMLGNSYWSSSFARDMKLEAERYRKAAEQGDANAQYHLGICYSLGIGVSGSVSLAVEWYRKAAKQGHAGAQYNLGWCYEKGRDVAKNETLAAEWYRKAAEQGNAYAQCELSECYKKGKGVDKNEALATEWGRRASENFCRRKGPQEIVDTKNIPREHYENGSKKLLAIEWYRRAAEQNYAKAQYMLGVCYEEGIGVDKDEALAADWYRKAVENLCKAAEYGNVQVQYMLGICYDDGKGVATDEKLAAEWYRKAAEQGDANAQFVLGVCYEYGSITINRNQTFAAEWYRKAARQGHADAQFRMGEYGDAWHAANWYFSAAEQGHTDAQLKIAECYEVGKNGFGRDYSQALAWRHIAAVNFRRAAEQGDANAQYNLGICYSLGIGVSKDDALAAEWCRRAAEQGNCVAQNKMGERYASNDVAKNEVPAVEWYRRAAEQGNCVAQEHLGRCYRMGIGVSKDERFAVEWYRRAAEQGYAYAQSILGYCYQHGIGVPKDERLGQMWISRAYRRGSTRHVEYIPGLCGFYRRSFWKRILCRVT